MPFMRYIDDYSHHNDLSFGIKSIPMNTNNLNAIGEQVRTLRKQKGWSQQKLAELSGLDRTTIGAFERNDYSDIGIRKVQRVLELLGKRLAVTDTGLPTLDQLQSSKSPSREPR
jgi:transcriptional regulator with XRE-family HTH domain